MLVAGGTLGPSRGISVDPSADTQTARRGAPFVVVVQAAAIGRAKALGRVCFLDRFVRRKSLVSRFGRLEHGLGFLPGLGPALVLVVFFV